MKDYIKPTIITNTELIEGVYLNSGDSCYTTTANIHQRPEIGRGDYRIQINGKHNADHSCDNQILTISFNQNVVYKNSNGQLIDGSNTITLKIRLSYHNNPTDNIGFGDLIVESEQGLAIIGVSISDEGYRY